MKDLQKHFVIRFLKAEVSSSNSTLFMDDQQLCEYRISMDADIVLQYARSNASL